MFVFRCSSSRGTEDPPPNDINLDEEILNMDPMVKPWPKMLSLDEKTLLNVARANNVLSQVTVRVEELQLLVP